MSQGWENHEPAPMEFFHGHLMELFHEWRKQQPSNNEKNSVVEIDGGQLNNLIAKAKIKTYDKYPKQNLREAILKSEIFFVVARLLFSPFMKQLH